MSLGSFHCSLSLSFVLNSSKHPQPNPLCLLYRISTPLFFPPFLSPSLLCHSVTHGALAPVLCTWTCLFFFLPKTTSGAAKRAEKKKNSGQWLSLVTALLGCSWISCVLEGGGDVYFSWWICKELAEAERQFTVCMLWGCFEHISILSCMFVWVCKPNGNCLDLNGMLPC